MTDRAARILRLRQRLAELDAELAALDDEEHYDRLERIDRFYDQDKEDPNPNTNMRGK